MADWNAPLPPNDVQAGEAGHPQMHNEIVDAITEIRANVDAIGAASVAWDDVTGKPDTFAPTIGTTADTAVAGNDSRLSVGAAGTATVRALGTGATQAAAGNHTHTASAITATAISPGTATDVQGILAELAARIAALEGA